MVSRIITSIFNDVDSGPQIQPNLKLFLGDKDFTVVPSQFWSSSDDAELESWEGTSLTGLNLANCIRRLEYLPLPPQQLQSGGLPSPPATSPAERHQSAFKANAPEISAVTLRRHLKTGVDHVLFIYPMQYDRFQYRFVVVIFSRLCSMIVRTTGIYHVAYELLNFDRRLRPVFLARKTSSMSYVTFTTISRTVLCFVRIC